MQPTDRIFFIDTETAGIKMPACEIGIIETDHQLNIVAEWQHELDPEVPIKASASAVHGMRNADLADKPTLAQWSMMTPNPMLYSGAVAPWIVAHKARFDLEVLATEVPADHRACCTLKIARKLYPGLAEQGENHQLQTLCYMFDLFSIEPLKGFVGEAHRVKFDIRCTIAFMKYVMQAHGLSIDEVLELGNTPYSADQPMWFGKHVGTPLRDVMRDTGYIRWCLGAKDMDPDFLEALAPLRRV